MTHEMVAVEEHSRTIMAAVEPVDTAQHPIGTAVGYTLARPVYAAVDIPVFDNSAMDGFAVRYRDVEAASATAPVILRVVADVPAGSRLDPPLRSGEAARIMTGAPVPSAADTIVPFEHTRDGLAASLDTTTVVRAPAAIGAHVRRRAEDLGAGDLLLPAGIHLGALQAGAIAAAGVDSVVVARRPRVAVIATGSELARPGVKLERGMIPESNGILLAALAEEAGAEVVLRDTVSDDGDDLRGSLDEAVAVRADVAIMSGGVSAGAYEVVKSTLEATGAMRFSTVAMQPGKPQGFGRSDHGMLLFGLPGNPVSSAVSFEVFVRPALLSMQGRVAIERPTLRLPADVGWNTPKGRRQYLPAVIDRSDHARWTVRPATDGGSRSHLAGGLGRAEAYAVVPAETERVEPGDTVTAMLVR